MTCFLNSFEVRLWKWRGKMNLFSLNNIFGKMSLWMNWLSLNHFGQNKYERCYLATLKAGLYKSESTNNIVLNIYIIGVGSSMLVQCLSFQCRIFGFV